jgi:hypothetical protein
MLMARDERRFTCLAIFEQICKPIDGGWLPRQSYAKATRPSLLNAINGYRQGKERTKGPS